MVAVVPTVGGRARLRVFHPQGRPVDGYHQPGDHQERQDQPVQVPDHHQEDAADLPVVQGEVVVEAWGRGRVGCQQHEHPEILVVATYSTDSLPD